MKLQGYKSRKREKKVSLSFRIPIEEKNALDELALLEGISVTKLVRDVLNSHISQSVKRDLDRMEFERIKSNLDSLRELFAVSVEALLVASGNVAKEEAQEWVNREIRND